MWKKKGGGLDVGVGGGGERHTTSQRTTWLSAGQPVQPANCSSPTEFMTMGLSRVPVGEKGGRLAILCCVMLWDGFVVVLTLCVRV